jgi:hypothetical protein
MSSQAGRSPAAPAPEVEQGPAPSGRLVLAGVGGTVLWVLTWLTVQMHGFFGWALPLVPGFR